MLNVMIVDNEAAIRKGLIHCIHWEDLGCQIAAQADDGVAALEQIVSAAPDIIISDIRMPGMDGLELAQAVSERYPHIKVIILTGYPDFVYAQRAIQYHVVDFVLKPTTVESLTHAIEKAKAAIAEDRSSQTLQRELATTSKHNLQLQRSMLLHDLIHRIDCSQLYVFNRLAQLDMDLSSYFVLKLHIDPLEGETLTETEFSDNLTQSQEILTDCLSEYPVYYIARGTQDCYGVVCAAGEAPVTALCREAVNIVGSLPRFTLSIGISNCRDNPIVLADAADEAAQAVQFASFTPDQPVVHFAELGSFPQQLTDAIYDQLCTLKAAIDSRSSAEVSRTLDEIFAFVHEHKLPPDTVRNVCVYIHQFCMDLQFPQAAEHMIADGGMSSLKRILETASVAEMEECTRSFARQMLELVQDGGTNIEHLILSVKAYVDSHYGEALSLDQLAQQFYLSPSYLSRIFKRETGVNLSTYLQNVRIDAAKTLLRTSNLKSYEVAERVGINDPVYFSRIFKKITGFKPKDYRHSVQKEETDKTPGQN
ncbi:MAG: response regulator transcription factor [Butyricicoccus sp.]|nr:response regulator transcription factor [Butyricicoccus sp.]